MSRKAKWPPARGREAAGNTSTREKCSSPSAKGNLLRYLPPPQRHAPWQRSAEARAIVVVRRIFGSTSSRKARAATWVLAQIDALAESRRTTPELGEILELARQQGVDLVPDTVLRLAREGALFLHWTRGGSALLTVNSHAGEAAS